MATALGSYRYLTNGEISMMQTMFKTAINYSAVKIHNDEYFPFGIQDDTTAVTPNGEMYWPRRHFKEDYSSELWDKRRWYMHEATHIWQYNMV